MSVSRAGARVVAVRPPGTLLAAAAFAVGAGVVLLVVDDFLLHVFGYVLASFVDIGLVAAFTRIDAGRRQHSHYVASHRLRRVIPVLVLLGLVVAAGHVWFIATELAG
jgi:hypothetical protein